MLILAATFCVNTTTENYIFHHVYFLMNEGLNKIATNVPGLAEGVDLELCPPGPEAEFIIKS